MQKNEDEARNKAAQANEAFKLQLVSTNSVRREFFRNNLPRILKVNNMTKWLYYIIKFNFLSFLFSFFLFYSFFIILYK